MQATIVIRPSEEQSLATSETRLLLDRKVPYIFSSVLSTEFEVFVNAFSNLVSIQDNNFPPFSLLNRVSQNGGQSAFASSTQASHPKRKALVFTFTFHLESSMTGRTGKESV